MTPETPMTCSSTRIARGEKYTTPAAVLSEEPCLIVPYYQGETMGSFLGPLESNKFVMFVSYTADVQKGDEITDDETGDKYVVIENPTHWKNPSDGFSNDHQQVIMRQSPISE